MGREKASYFLFLSFFFLWGGRGGLVAALIKTPVIVLLIFAKTFSFTFSTIARCWTTEKILKKTYTCIVGDVCHTKSIYVCQDTCQNQEPSNRLPLWPSRNFGRTCALSRRCGIYISIWIPCFTILILDVVLKKGLLFDNYWLPNDSVYSF